MRQLKQILASFLALVMILTIIPIHVTDAAEGSAEQELWLTEIYPNDVARNNDYTGLSGATIDSMDYIEVYNASDSPMDFGENFDLVYNAGTPLNLTFNEADVTIPANSAAIFWVRRVDLEVEGKTMPSEVDFRTSFGVSPSVPVFSVDNQKALKNTTATVSITAKSNNETISTFEYFTADAGETEGSSVHLRAVEGMTGSISISKQADHSAGQVSEVQQTVYPKPELVVGTVNRISDSMANVTITSDVYGGYGEYYYAVVEDGAEAPTIDTDGEGTEYVDDTEATLTLTELTAGAKDLYVVMKDGGAKNLSSVLELDIPAYEGTPPDVPTVKPGAVSRTSSSTATVTFTANVDGEYYYTVVEDGAGAPTINTDGIGTIYEESAEATISLTDLDAGAKDIYIVIKDEAGEESVPLKLDIEAYIPGVGELYLTEIYPNDIARNDDYTGFSGATTDTMDYIEVYNASDSALDFGANFNLNYNAGSSLNLTFNEDKVIIPANSAAIFWVRRVDLEEDGVTMPSEVDFRTSLGVPVDVPVFSVNNQVALKNTTAIVSINAKSNDESISSFAYVTADAGAKEGSSVHLRAADGITNSFSIATQAVHSAGRVSVEQETVYPKPQLVAGTVTRVSNITATVTFSSDQAGQYYYGIVSEGSEAPTISTDGVGTAIEVDTEVMIPLTELTAGAKDIYIVVKDDLAKNDSEVLKMDIPASLSNVPTIVPGTVSRTSDSRATVTFTSNVDGEYYYAVVEDGAVAPAIPTAGAGTVYNVGSEATISLTDLTAGAKDIYLVIRDEGGQVSEVLSLDIGAYIPGIGRLYLTEVYPNDIARNDIYTGLSGITIDSMDYIEVYNASDSDVDFGANFDLVYDAGTPLFLTFDEAVIPANSAAVFWVRRVDLEKSGVSMPSEVDFRTSLGIPASVPVFSVNNQRALANTTATVSIIAKSNEETISTYSYIRSDAGALEGSSVHFQAAEGRSKCSS